MSRIIRAKSSQLDDVSKSIIEELQHDGRKSYAEIGKTSPNAVAYNDKKVAAGTKYYYRVRAVKTANRNTYYSDYSNETNATTNSK